MRRRGTSISTEGDDAELAGSNVVAFVRPAVAEPMLLGDLLSAFVLPELAVRMRGNFVLPRVMARAAREEE